MKAFQDAAGRYDLGQNGVWALAAVARVESNFGKGMSAEQLAANGPLGITRGQLEAVRGRRRRRRQGQAREPR